MVLRCEPSATTMSATSALITDTPMMSALVGDLICCHRLPSVVSRIVPWRPTTQHTVFDDAWPANKSAFTPLPSCCQLFWSVQRKIVPESSSAQITVRSGDETNTDRAAEVGAGGALVLSTFARGAETAAAGAAGILSAGAGGPY